MSNYNNYVRGLADSLEKSNMQMHMGTMTDDISSNHKEILQHIIDYEYNNFILLVYEASLGNNEKFFDGDLLKSFFVENERDLITIFSKMNEDCLNDPEFSKAIVNGKLYSKNIGSKKTDVLYYPPESLMGSKKNKVIMDLLYVPSISSEQPNRFRIDVKEILNQSNDYPYINFNVDIGDDGSITYNQPVLINKQDNNSNIVEIPSDMSQSHICFNEKGIEALSYMFMYLFEKTGIKENIDNKKM